MKFEYLECDIEMTHYLTVELSNDRLVMTFTVVDERYDCVRSKRTKVTRFATTKEAKYAFTCLYKNYARECMADDSKCIYTDWQKEGVKR